MFTSSTNIWRTCWQAVNLKLNCVFRNRWVTQQTHHLCNPAVPGGVQHDYYIAWIKEICIFDGVTPDAASSASWSWTCSLTSLKHLKQDVSQLHKHRSSNGRVREELVSYWLESDLWMWPGVTSLLWRVTVHTTAGSASCQPLLALPPSLSLFLFLKLWLQWKCTDKDHFTHNISGYNSTKAAWNFFFFERVAKMCSQSLPGQKFNTW